jgi:hypothetical protein
MVPDPIGVTIARPVRPTDPPQLSDSATRFLTAFDAQPLSLPTRVRIIRALGLVSSTEWDQVVAWVDSAELRRLQVAALDYRLDEFASVLRVARVIAYSYDLGPVPVGCIAVALAMTHEYPRSEATAQKVAEAFGLGELEGLERIIGEDLERSYLESQRPPKPTRADTRIDWRYDTSALTLWRIATWTHVALRVAIAGILVFRAVSTEADWVAYLVAGLALLVATRDPRESLPDDVGFLPPVSKFQLRIPLSGYGYLAVGAAIAGLWWQAAVLLIAELLLERVAISGERTLLGGLHWTGPEVGEAGPEYRSLLRLPDAFHQRRRLARWRIAVGAALLPFGWFVIPLIDYWPLFVLAVISLVRARPVLAIAALIPMVLIAHASWLAVALAVANGLLGHLVLRLVDRAPIAAVPVARGLFRGGPGPVGRTRRALRQLRRAQPDLALAVLAGIRAPTPQVIALRAWAHVVVGDLGSARRSAEALPDNWSLERALLRAHLAATLRDDQALGDALTVLFAPGAKLSRRMREDARVVAPMLGMLTGEDQRLVGLGLLDFLINVRITADRVLLAARALELLSHQKLGTASALAGEIARVSGFMAGLAVRPGARGTARPTGVVESMRAALAITEAMAKTHSFDPVESIRELGLGDSGMAEIFTTWGLPIDAAGSLAALARRLDDEPGYRERAYEVRLELVAMLLAVRDGLATPADRAAWSKVCRGEVEAAIGAAARGRDGDTLAELIEAARNQDGPLNESADAPIVRVRGRSRLEETDWYTSGRVAPVVGIEQAAVAVAGDGAWWWGAWVADTDLYWALVPPHGDAIGGVTDLAASGLAAALKDPPEVEAARAALLGALIPDVLTDELADRGPLDPLPLAIAVGDELADVPWAALALDLAGAPRLVERARIVLAPPVELLAAIVERPDAGVNVPVRADLAEPADDSTMVLAVASTPLTAIGTSGMVDALRDRQLADLDAWRAGDRAAAPAHWARQAVTGISAPSSISAPPQPFAVAESLIQVIGEAAAFARGRGSTLASVRDLVLGLSGWGYGEELPFRRRIGAGALMLPFVLREAVSRRTVSVVGFDAGALRVIDRAARLAREARDSIVEPEHLIVATLMDDTLSAWVARRISGLDPRVRAEARRMMKPESELGYAHTARPSGGGALSPEAVEALYERFGVSVPRTDVPRRLRSDRRR